MPEVTPRQKEVGVLIAEGLTGRQIAERLGISTHAVNTHRAALFKAIGVNSGVSLVRYALIHGWIEIKPYSPEELARVEAQDAERMAQRRAERRAKRAAKKNASSS